MVKPFVKLLMPPIVFKFFDNFQRSRKSTKFHSYEDAIKSMGGDGYNNAIISQVVFKKNLEFSKEIRKEKRLDLSTLRTLIGISLVSFSEKLRVLDFGGGGGFHFFIAELALTGKCELDWNIVETPCMVKSCESLKSNNLKFYDMFKK